MENQDTILVIQEDQDTILVIQEDQDFILETRLHIFQTLFLMNQSPIKEMDKLDIIPVLQEDMVSTQETGLETLASILEVKDQTVLMKPLSFHKVSVQDITQDPRVVGEGLWQETKPGSAHQLCLRMMKTWTNLMLLLR